MNRESSTDDRRWFCIRTKRKWEDLTSVHMAMKGILVFNPKIEELHLYSTGIAPLFPSYIFANFSLSAEYYKVIWTPGVKQILGYGNRPIPVEDDIIYLIMDNVEEGTYIKPKFKPGDQVEIKSGVFSQLIGIFQQYSSGNGRVKVLLDLFNHRVDVELNVVDLEKVKLTCS